LRIAFDLNPVLVNRYSGFYSYGTGLLEGLAVLGDRPDFQRYCQDQGVV